MTKPSRRAITLERSGFQPTPWCIRDTATGKLLAAPAEIAANGERRASLIPGPTHFESKRQAQTVLDTLIVRGDVAND